MYRWVSSTWFLCIFLSSLVCCLSLSKIYSFVKLSVLVNWCVTQQVTNFFVTAALKDGLYHDVGVLLAMAVVHGGQFPNFMSQTAYNLLLKDDVPISVMDIPDSQQRAKIQQVGTY